jgi:environmental stress-induced protein Ves
MSIVTPGDWDGVLWRLGRTAIVAPGAFSDLTGYDRVQVVVAGQGLVLETPDGPLGVRMPFRPVRFRGETAITSRLEAGPVEVVNLIGARAAVTLDLQVLAADATRTLGVGTHVVHAPTGPVALRCDTRPIDMATDHALRIDADDRVTLRCIGGIALVASVSLRVTSGLAGSERRQEP